MLLWKVWFGMFGLVVLVWYLWFGRFGLVYVEVVFIFEVVFI